MAPRIVDGATIDLGQRVVGERLLHLEVFVTYSAFVLINRHDANLQLLEARRLAVNSGQRLDLSQVPPNRRAGRTTRLPARLARVAEPTVDSVAERSGNDADGNHDLHLRTTNPPATYPPASLQQSQEDRTVSPSVSDGPKPVRKAVIPAAGLGTRFLPFSKAVPKEMLPVIDRPVIQYVVEEAVDAGITDILIITSRYKKSIEDHFDRLLDLEAHLEAKGKDADAKQIRSLNELAQLHFVRQGEALGLGHAIGVARNHVGDEPFVVLLGDDIMHERAGVLKGMIEAYNEHHCSVVALMEVDPADISSYGCADAEPHADRLVRVNGLVEKPAPEVAPSNLAIMGRYLFTPSIFSISSRRTTQYGRRRTASVSAPPSS